MILTCQFDELCAVNPFGDIAAFFDAGIQITGAMKHQRWNPDGRQHVADVDRGVHSGQGERCAWTRATALICRPPIAKPLIVRQTWGKVVYADRAAPFFLDCVKKILSLLRRRRPWVFGIPDPGRENSEGD